MTTIRIKCLKCNRLCAYRKSTRRATCHRCHIVVWQAGRGNVSHEGIPDDPVRHRLESATDTVHVDTNHRDGLLTIRGDGSFARAGRSVDGDIAVRELVDAGWTLRVDKAWIEVSHA